MPSHRFVLFAAFFAAVVSAAQVPPATPAGGKFTCATCHRQQAESQPHTPMGMALQLPLDQTLLKTSPKLTFKKDGFAYSIERDGGQSIYTVSDGRQNLTLPIKYAFGAGMQTYVLEHDGRLYESLVSYYPTVGGLSATMGDETLSPHSVLEALGRELGPGEVAACFGCHTTGSAAARLPAPGSFKPGLTCEHCHVGAQAHLEALSHGKPGVLPKRLGGMAAEDTSEFCGACHRTFSTVVRLRLFGQLNVRFQPYRLAKSQCFNGADPRISCTSCHDPHRDLVTDVASYDPKCLACHNGGIAAQNIALIHVTGPSPRSCPVANNNCVSCHMPKTELPGSHTQFTDHMIRIVKPDEPYPE